MVRIVHSSDWHGQKKKLPFADIYIFTGDMYPNFGVPPRDVRSVIWDPIEPVSEAKQQRNWASSKDGQLRSVLENQEAPVLCVRGNHDFTDARFQHMNAEEIFVPVNTFEACGLKFGGMRGVPPINARWADELEDAEFEYKARQLPDDIDVLVTHAPPYGILDDITTFRPLESEYLGSQALRAYVNRRHIQEGNDKPALKLHCFGHIHERGGQLEKHGNTWFSNAATTFNIIDL